MSWIETVALVISFLGLPSALLGLRDLAALFLKKNSIHLPSPLLQRIGDVNVRRLLCAIVDGGRCDVNQEALEQVPASDRIRPR